LTKQGKRVANPGLVWTQGSWEKNFIDRGEEIFWKRGGRGATDRKKCTMKERTI
jgi:hypothetical protein